MASNAASIQGKRASLIQYPSPNASLFLEKTKAGIRRSTPDSEALASSDDEPDHLQRSVHMPAQQGARNNRRPSWLNDSYHPPRQSSTGGLETFPANGPHQTLSSQDASSWSSPGALASRGNSVTASLPWNSGIWNNEAQKVLPSRFAEVLPSPTSLSSTSGNVEESSQSPPRRDSASEAAIPFAIPLHPTLKSYRSQSYSVGQLDQDTALSIPLRTSQYLYNGRTRAGSSYSGLQHRPSRPSMLGEFSADTSILSQLREVEDDEESTTSSDAGVRFSNNQARTIEQLAMENAILRQQALASQPMPTPSSNTSFGIQSNSFTRAGSRNLQINDSVLEELDDGSINEEDHGSNQILNKTGHSGRRYSEYSASPDGQYFLSAAPENRSVEGLKKGHWQSSLGFGGLSEGAQSRRHSFADVPKRQAPITLNVDPAAARIGDPRNPMGHGEKHTLPGQSGNASYFSNSMPRNSETYRPSSSHSPAQPGFSSHEQTRPQQFGQLQSHQGQSLYLVTFKAARAEFYYVQEGTGLDVNPGDLVIVEADRGTDLGTVAHRNVDWASAREMKEHYIAEHYNWLMMFSRQGQSGQALSSFNSSHPGVYPGKPNLSAAGGIGPQAPQSAADSLNTEIKPKMIKRLAQNHEIHTLREKEGNEAKAKRMCQQKVAEHHLNMEILDAEFQMDWKKLTFYYFADSYINFNSLVTDLFKIYKTRIWMSAINPASFVSPATGLQLSSGPLSAAPLLDHDRYTEGRSRPENYGFTSAPHLEGSYSVVWSESQNGNLATSALNSSASNWPTQGLHQLGSQTLDYGRGFSVPPTSNSAYRSGSNTAGIEPQPRSNPKYQDEMIKPVYSDRLQSFQGLSLGSN